MGGAEAMTARIKLGIDNEGLCSQPEHTDMIESFLAATALERRGARNLCGHYGQENACPVREECLRWALENKEIWGVWGGCDESELRRALWVDANGHHKPRCRYPNCPNCKARPNRLRVVQELDSSVPTIVCVNCDFTWRSRTSAQAVKAYYRARNRRRLAAKSPARRRLVEPTVRQPARPLPSDARVEEEPLALVASAAT